MLRCFRGVVARSLPPPYPEDRSWFGSGSGLHRVGAGHDSVVALAQCAHRHDMIPLHQRENPRISLRRVAGSSRPPDPEDRSWFGSGSGLHGPVIGHTLVVPLQGLVRSEGCFAIGSFGFACILKLSPSPQTNRSIGRVLAGALSSALQIGLDLRPDI